ncbi:SWIRM-domain-containing protein [Trichodelitschia bisporula]|uniref:SWIRM-domain-containing protein n=1 Tax=Trichodelitschia bisporula TaxID=703511 RepID=A0A6G1I182_9PEZI|nr:SWIRM-domain-containing protein [Trichodelitschia bisporula]
MASHEGASASPVQDNVSGQQSAVEDIDMSEDVENLSLPARKSKSPTAGPTPARDGTESEDQTKASADAPEDTEMGGVSDSKREADTEAEAANKAAIESAARSHLAAQTHQIILPSYSTWFDMHAIHNIEKKALPEWFNSRNHSKTPATYKDARDFMINTYRLNPVEYLTFTACRRNLCGDVCALMRVHGFLESWGLINYQVDPDTRPSNIGPPFTGHFRLIADTPRGLQAVQPAPNTTVTSGKPHPRTDRLAKAGTPSKSDTTFEIRRNIYESNGKEATPAEIKEKIANGESSTANGTGESGAKELEEALKEPVRQYFCFTCGNDCTRVRYHNSKAPPPGVTGSAAQQTKYDICPTCFMEKRYPVNSSNADFTKLENEAYSIIPDPDAPWTEAEELLLLEGLEMYDDDWNKISDYVGTRTREDCVMKFLQMEIEDKYQEPDGQDNLAARSSKALSYLGNGRIPFSTAENPVLSVMSFLVGLADPRLATIAAGKATDEVRRDILNRLERGDPDAEPSAGSAVKPDDSAMDIDAAIRSDPLSTLPFALTASRAAGLASHEERNATRLINAAANLQMTKLDLKLNQFAELEGLLAAERRDLERRRQALFLDRLAFQKRVQQVEEAFVRAMNLGPQEGMSLVRDMVTAAREGEVGVKRRNAEAGDVAPLPVGESRVLEL